MLLLWVPIAYKYQGKYVDHYPFFCSAASATAVRNIKKHQAVEMAFTMFPPLGAKVKNVITVPLPWLHPLMDGRGGSKKSGKNFSLSEGCERNERHNSVESSASPSKISDFQEFATQNL